jgi:hypothetical protein
VILAYSTGLREAGLRHLLDLQAGAVRPRVYGLLRLCPSGRLLWAIAGIAGPVAAREAGPSSGSGGADAAAPLVGLGSVCRRQATTEIARIVAELAALGLRLHGFGVKRAGLVSADSMAWSYHARRRPPLPGCVGQKNCANCLPYALAWRARMLAILDQPRQGRLPLYQPADHLDRGRLGGAA